MTVNATPRPFPHRRTGQRTRRIDSSDSRGTPE